MNAGNESIADTLSRPKFSLPWDLEEWFDRGTLLKWIKDEVGTLGWEKPEVVAYLEKHPTFRPRTLLSLLTWGYITGRLGFGEITEACGSEPQFRTLVGSELPAVSSQARFRRDNRALLKWSVSQVFKRTVREKFDLSPEEFLPAGLRRHLENDAVTRLDLARQVDHGAVHS